MEDPIHAVVSDAAEGASLRLARSMRDARRSPLVELFVSASGADVVSFAIGMPAAELLPTTALAASCARVLAGRAVLQYGVPSPGLRAQVAALMARRGVRCAPEQVFLTTGSQQAMDLLVRLLLDPGGEVMIEDVVFEGIRLAMRPFRPRIRTVPSSPVDGLDVDEVARLLAEGARPAFLYLVPEGHNPQGTSLGPEQRLRLVDLARRHRLPIVEDDAYGFLTYAPEPMPALRALDERWVVYLGSFSKILAPSLRVGWLVVPEELVDPLSALKHGMDVDTSTLAQHVLCDLLETVDFAAHLERLRAEYDRRRAALVAALERQAPAGLEWRSPAAGFYLWAELEPGRDATALLRHALATERVAFTPGAVFALPGHERAARSLRLSFASVPVERMDEGVGRLARALATFRG